MIALTLMLVVSCSANGSTAADPVGTTAASSPDPTTVSTIDSTTPSGITTTVVPAATTTTTTTGTSPATVPIEPAADLVPAVSADEPCDPGWAPFAAVDEVTFARGRDIFTYAPSTGELRCLATVDREPRRLDWNPAGDRLLIDSDLILTESGIAPSGFAPGTPGITWSQPTGTALIAPSADGTELLHVSADRPDDVFDVSSLATTWVAAYHPAGTAIFSAGISDVGVAGIYIADNRGRDPHPLVTLDDQTTLITELVVAHDGSWIAFVHDHTHSEVSTGASVDTVAGPDGVHESGSHVHRLFLPTLALDDLATAELVPAGLVTSEQDDGLLAWTTTFGTANTQSTVMTEDAVVLNFRPSEGMSTPIGFLDAGTTVLVNRPVGAPASQPADLYIRPTSGGPTLISAGVTAASTRTVHDSNWQEPPLDIEQQAVG